MSLTPVHLLVVVHGLWGTRAHVQYIVDSAKKNVTPAYDANGKQIKLVVLSTLNSEWTKTYDGIDVNAERVVNEIDAECKKIREEGGECKRFSIVGYSLGGLVARYTLGLLESRSPSFFDEIKPVNFTTFASPAIGIPAYKSFWSAIIRYLGARLLSRSGSQLYGTDRFFPQSLDGSSSPKASEKKSILARIFSGKETGEPLLSVLADPRFSFFKALLAFQRVEIFANAVNDRTVPFPTGAIEAHDPFALARARARTVMDVRGEDVDCPIDYAEGGINIVMDPNHSPLIKSYTTSALARPTSPSTARQPSMPKRRFVLPLLLRPTTYPFSRPVSLAIIVFLPIALPLSLLFLIGQFMIQTRQSRLRIDSLRKELGGGRDGWLERVGVKLQQVVDETLDHHPDSTSDSSSASANSATPFNLAFDGSAPAAETERPSSLRNSSFAAFAAYKEGVETPPLARPVLPSDSEDVTAEGTTIHPYPSDPILTDRQLVMIKNLNSIPQMRKHLAFLPLARNSHGSIVCRDVGRFASHAEGKPVVDFWASEFVL